MTNRKFVKQVAEFSDKWDLPLGETDDFPGISKESLLELKEDLQNLLDLCYVMNARIEQALE